MGCYRIDYIETNGMTLNIIANSPEEAEEKFHHLAETELDFFRDMTMIDSDIKIREIPVCPHCGKLLIPSDKPGFKWQCVFCEQDFYDESWKE